MKTLTNTVVSPFNLDKKSFSKKEILVVLDTLKVDSVETDLSLSSIKKTMIGKKEALTVIVNTCITVYQDDTGMVYTVDQLLVDLDKRLGKTFTAEVFNTVLKDIWGAVSSSLHMYPKGHKLIKDVVIALNKEFAYKKVVGIAQVREVVLLASVEAYFELSKGV